MTDWNVEEAKDSIKNGGRFGAKRVMEAVYRNNIAVFHHWGYRLPGGKLVGLGDRNALLNGDSIVLGAFGCGVNKLPCDAVADQFCRVFAEAEFAGKFRALVFAILEGRGSTRRPVEESGKFAPFYATFGRWQGM